jgi:lipid-A-disaccharide synthase-like uncharacterized protein
MDEIERFFNEHPGLEFVAATVGAAIVAVITVPVVFWIISLFGGW